MYVTASKSLNRWNLSGGLRFDYRYLNARGLIEDGEVRFEDFTRHFKGVTGSLGVTCEITEGLDLKLNFARGYRAPNISELASNGEHEGSLRYEIGNHDFKPEYSLQADLGLNYATRYFELHGAVFANHISNYIYLHRIDSIIEPDLMTFAYAQGEAMLIGFEAGLDIHPFHALHVGSSFSYVNAQLLHQPEEMKWLPMTPAPRLSVDMKYELTHDGKVFNNAYLAARMDWYLEQDHYYAAYDTETKTPSYLLLGLSAGTDVLIKGKTTEPMRCEMRMVIKKMDGTPLAGFVEGSYTGRLCEIQPGEFTMERHIRLPRYLANGDYLIDLYLHEPYRQDFFKAKNCQSLHVEGFFDQYAKTLILSSEGFIGLESVE